ncbi:hypothetical protein LWI29_005792 [Acer saccharum]|uniref:Uncharacterized protein n=1 Tax=Acer saccharum TaxID=4024 RepID=A0AA39VSK4_ACESA|nr:hypothetical protein LWI29_005792 [Acer saccharum]
MDKNPSHRATKTTTTIRPPPISYHHQTLATQTVAGLTTTTVPKLSTIGRRFRSASICSSSAQHRLTLFCPTSIDSLLPSQSFTETNLSSRPIYSSSARPICFKDGD